MLIRSIQPAMSRRLSVSWITTREGLQFHSNATSHASTMLRPSMFRLAAIQFTQCHPELINSSLNCHHLNRILTRTHKHSSQSIRGFLSDRERVREFVDGLDLEDRRLLLQELNNISNVEATKKSVSESVTTPEITSHQHSSPTMSQLSMLGFQQSLPYVGFGFLDNFLMIIFGEYIEIYLGLAFGITTMAAAGLGNALSDMTGVGAAYYIERGFEKLGFHPPKLSLAQLQMKQTRWTTQFGRVMGIMIGCLIGMFPLFFFEKKKPNKDDDKAK